MKRRDLRLWLALAAGPLAWAIALNVGYAVSPPAHHAESIGELYALNLAAFAVALIAGIASARELRAVSAGDVTGQRRRFLAVAGIALAIVSMLLVIATALPALMLTPGAEP